MLYGTPYELGESSTLVNVTGASSSMGIPGIDYDPHGGLAAKVAGNSMEFPGLDYDPHDG